MERLAQQMYAAAVPGAERPTSEIIGKNSEGAFRTAAHKEYPDQFGRGLAVTIGNRLWLALRTGRARMVPCTDMSLRTWVEEALTESDRISENAQFLPDYQGS